MNNNIKAEKMRDSKIHRSFPLKFIKYKYGSNIHFKINFVLKNIYK